MYTCRAELYFQEAYHRNGSKLDALVAAVYLRHMTAKVRGGRYRRHTICAGSHVYVYVYDLVVHVAVATQRLLTLLVHAHPKKDQYG
jgi:hypothetical protein